MDEKQVSEQPKEIIEKTIGLGSSTINDNDLGSDNVCLNPDVTAPDVSAEDEAPVGLIKLGVRQERFCVEYVKDYNATKAYIKAYNIQGDLRPGGSEYQSAAVNGSKALNNTKIISRIKQLEEYRASSSKVTPDYVVSLCRKIVEGYTNTGKVYKEGFGAALSTLKDFAGIASKSEVKTDSVKTDEMRQRVKELLKQQAKVRKTEKPIVMKIAV